MHSGLSFTSGTFTLSTNIRRNHNMRIITASSRCDYESVCADALPGHIFYIRCVCVQCYHGDLKWRSLSNFRQFVGTCSSALPFDPLSVCLGRAQEFASTSRAHCQPAWHHQIYFYSLQIEPLLYPYWHIPRLRGAWLHSRTSTGAKLCLDCLQKIKQSRWSDHWLLMRTNLFLSHWYKKAWEWHKNKDKRGSDLKCVHFLFKKRH